MTDIKNSFLATLSLTGKPLVILQHKLEYLLSDGNLSPEQHDKFSESLGREFVRKLITVTEPGSIEPLTLYFRRDSDNYTIFIRSPITFRSNTFSMEYAAREMIAYNGHPPTRFHLIQDGREVTLTDLSDNNPQIGLFSHSKEINIKAVSHTPMFEHFTDLPSRIDGQTVEFDLNILERNVAPLPDEIR